uniref:Uncharacterized protein n=1 Tax=Manihot esculenta TaxID=3983 RepID=A0A2C9WJJ3_MANES
METDKYSPGGDRKYVGEWVARDASSCIRWSEEFSAHVRPSRALASLAKPQARVT